MKAISAIRFGLVVLLALGCGRHELPYYDNSKDSDLYAQNVRKLVLELAEAARSSGEPRTQINVIVTELSHDDRPVGSYKQTYSDLLATSRSILDRCPPGGGKPDIRKEIDQLIGLARTLPEKKR
jgi:hypothetical protein